MVKAKKRILIIMIGVFIVPIFIIGRLIYLQFIIDDELKKKTANQQNSERYIIAARGTIFDSTKKNILAKSYNVETVTVSPMNINVNNKEQVAKALSDILELDYEKVLKKVNKKSKIEIIARRVEKDKTNNLRKWMEDNNLYSGINIDEDIKRYYPFGNLASHVIGFCGSDLQGLEGIEAKYDDILKGDNGEIRKLVNAKGIDFDEDTEEYIKPLKGNDIVLSIDAGVQSIVEKYLENACIDNKCTDGGSIIIMNPKNGDVVAMAGYPNYDLNEPFEINNEEFKLVWDTLSLDEKNEKLLSMWRNKSISDTYEPGSTFKIVTSSAAIEEKIASGDDVKRYSCSGSIQVSGVRIRCWRYYSPHGSQSLREALMNSCNPVFIGLGEKIGVEKYYDYLEKFGFFRKTGIDLPGEAKGIFLKEEKVGPVELATISFGQRFEVTPLQMITMVSSISNGGVYVKPRILKEVIDSKTGEITEIKPSFGDRIVSEQTAKDVLSMMESVVSEGTGKNARVEGYKIGGKTGTSEDGVNTGKYVTSFIGVVDTLDPKLTILVTLYNPTGEGGHQGGSVAAPLAGSILKEVIEYLEI